MQPTSVFIIKAYGWQELAIRYSPEVSPVTASRRLKSWVHLHPHLAKELKALGWKPSHRLLTPIQVETIVKHLGEP